MKQQQGSRAAGSPEEKVFLRFAYSVVKTVYGITLN